MPPASLQTFTRSWTASVISLLRPGVCEKPRSSPLPIVIVSAVTPFSPPVFVWPAGAGPHGSAASPKVGPDGCAVVAVLPAAPVVGDVSLLRPLPPHAATSTTSATTPVSPRTRLVDIHPPGWALHRHTVGA